MPESRTPADRVAAVHRHGDPVTADQRARATALLTDLLAAADGHGVTAPEGTPLMLTQPVRCATAHPTDSSLCDTLPDAVIIVDQNGVERFGCVHHGARALASMTYAHVLCGPMSHVGYGLRSNAATDALHRSRTLAPFDWLESEAS